MRILMKPLPADQQAGDCESGRGRVRGRGRGVNAFPADVYWLGPQRTSPAQEYARRTGGKNGNRLSLAHRIWYTV